MEDIKHLKESLSLMTAITDDERFIESYISLKKKRRVNMCTVLDEIEERGIKKGIEKGIEQGLTQGITQGIERGISQGQDEVLAVNDWLFENGRIEDVKRASHDKAYFESLLIEYNNSKKNN